MNNTHCMHTTQRNTMHSNEMNNVQRCIPVHLKQEYNTATVDDTPQCNSMYCSTFKAAHNILTTMQFNAFM